LSKTVVSWEGPLGVIGTVNAATGNVDIALRYKLSGTWGTDYQWFHGEVVADDDIDSTALDEMNPWADDCAAQGYVL